ncbi:MAG: AMP-binding protein, partial [Pseudomonadales bacterium]
MYPGKYAQLNPDRPAFIMASTGESVSYADYEIRTNQLAHLLRAEGLGRLDHYSIFMENNNRYLECCGAGERAGLYYTCVNHYLKADELAYILNNSESQVLIVSSDKLAVALEALVDAPAVTLCLVIGSAEMPDSPRAELTLRSFEQAVAGYPGEPIADEALGTSMLYSSGTTGRPKGILRPLPQNSPEQHLPLYDFLLQLWHYREDMIYLSPAPLYHSAPQAAVGLTLRKGGTVVIMERFDPEEYLAYVPRYNISHTQLVPTMFSRMLKLPAEIRAKADVSSLEIAIHAAAPCPAKVKEQMIEWWGPIIHE